MTTTPSGEREHEDAPAANAPANALARLCADRMLDAYRSGNFAGEWPAPSDAGEQQFLEALLRPARIVAGSALAPSDISSPAELVLRWGVNSLRPDRAPANAPIDRSCWLERASWRPALALMCHCGFVEVPDFPDHYYRRRGEPPVETLCGLWGIGSSSFYRLLDTAKRRLAQLSAEQVQDGRHSASLQSFAQGEVYDRLGLKEGRDQAQSQGFTGRPNTRRAHRSAPGHCQSLSVHQRAGARAGHALGDAFARQIDALRQTFEQSHTTEERLARAWHEATRLSEGALRRTVRRLLQDGQISKSAYAEACNVGLATASKHLARLAEAGLLRQIGKGAGTRYVLELA